MTKKTKKILIGVAVVALVSSLAVLSCKVNQPQVGVIDFEVVQQKAKAYVDASQKQQKQDEQIQSIILKDKEYIKLQEEAKKLAEQENKLSPDEFRRKSEALQKKVLVMNQKYQPSFARNVQASMLAMQKLQGHIQDAIQATADCTGVKILIPKNAVLHMNESADVTQKFIEELDERVQTVDYPDPVTLQ